MPLVIDNNTRSWESFDVQTASTLYWKALPVLVKQNDREEQTSELTVRILSGLNRNNHNSRVSNQLHLYYTVTVVASVNSSLPSQHLLTDIADPDPENTPFQ